MRDPAMGAAAVYIAESTAELAALARKHDLEFLAVVLEMAKLEAEITIKGDTRLFAAEMMVPPIQTDSCPPNK